MYCQIIDIHSYQHEIVLNNYNIEDKLSSTLDIIIVNTKSNNELLKKFMFAIFAFIIRGMKLQSFLFKE